VWWLGLALGLAFLLAAGPAAGVDLYVEVGVNSPYDVKSDEPTYYNGYVGATTSGAVLNQNDYTFAAVRLNIGFNDGSSGAYNQSGGTNSNYELILGRHPGSSGAYNQSGGTNSNYYLYVGAGGSGSYTLSGGSLTGYYEERVNTGSFTQSGAPT